MVLSFTLAGHTYSFDASAPLDISIALDFYGEQPSAFHISHASATVLEEGGFIGDTRRGGSCNCETVTFNPHGNGTHTECIGHIADERVAVGEVLRESFIPATVVSVALGTGDDEEGVIDSNDAVVTRDALQAAIDALGAHPNEFFRALVVRTLPNDRAKLGAMHSGANPPYLSLRAMRLVRELGVEHLLIDLPSVDRESDAGALAGHRIFWDAPDRGNPIPPPFNARTITEMVFIEDSIADGRYVLNLQIPNFILDAAPSRPILYRIADVP